MMTMEDYNVVKARLSDAEWRLNHLYWITDKDGKTRRFRMNWAQERLWREKHTRNIILKVRQLGISTFVAILILDMCLFKSNVLAGIVDKTEKDAFKKMAKIKFAWDRMGWCPENASEEERAIAELGAKVKAELEAAGKCVFSTTEAKLSNGSNIYAGVSLRGGTHQILHVSELGYVACHNPMKANETITGSLESVGKGGMVFMESTHEGGQTGLHYRLVVEAMNLVGRELTPLDNKFFFFSWVQQDEYALDGYKFSGDAELTKYFAMLEREHGIVLTEGQKAWYESKRRTQGSKMKQEYPTIPEEALNPQVEGAIFGQQVAMLRETGRLYAEFEADAYRPIYAAFDKGLSDYTSIWFIQCGADGKFYILDNYTANDKPLSWYISVVRAREAQWGKLAGVVLPHDGSQRDYELTSYFTKFEEAGFYTMLVRRTTDPWNSIDNARTLLRHAVIHARCNERTVTDARPDGYISGTNALATYRMAPPGRDGVIRNEPLHDESSHAADALRTFADAWATGMIAQESGWMLERGKRQLTPGAKIGAEVYDDADVEERGGGVALGADIYERW